MCLIINNKKEIIMIIIILLFFVKIRVKNTTEFHTMPLIAVWLNTSQWLIILSWNTFSINHTLLQKKAINQYHIFNRCPTHNVLVDLVDMSLKTLIHVQLLKSSVFFMNFSFSVYGPKTDIYCNVKAIILPTFFSIFFY